MTDPAGRDILDAIDELVDEQLAGFDNRSGWDHDVNQDVCPHKWCSEPWHGLAIAARMREMRRLHRSTVAYYEDEPRVSEETAAALDAYRYDEDDSEIICPGSTFEGEFTPVTPPSPPATVRVWSNEGWEDWESIGYISGGGIQFTRADEASLDLVRWTQSLRNLEMTFQLLIEPSRSATVYGILTGAAAAVQSGPHWWRCDDIRGHDDIHLETAEYDHLGSYNPPHMITEPRRYVLRVGRQVVELMSERYTGIHARHGVGFDGRYWMEVHSYERPPADGWYLRDEDPILTLDQLRQLQDYRLPFHSLHSAMDADLDHMHAAEFRGRVRQDFPAVHIADIAATEVGRDEQTGIVTRELFWLAPDSRTGELRGGPGTGRTQNLHRPG
ncbi:hypothetical protein ACFXON_23455, partial [Bacillus subtilis]